MSEGDCSSMYAVAPMWTNFLGRENGVAAFRVRLAIQFGRTNMGPKSKRKQLLDTSPSQPLSMPLTQQKNRKTTHERTPHQVKRHRRNWIPTQFLQKQALFFGQKHVCSLVVASSLMCWTVLKTVLSEHFSRQLCMEAHRRLEDPTVPKP